MSYTKEQFLADVKAEAVALREHATKEELGRLNIDEFDPNDAAYCIYGQVALDCQSDRAIELISKCCTRFFINNRGGEYMNRGFSAVKENVNGAVVENFRIDRIYGIKHFTAIETYILLDNAQNANLISYLRGETDDLNL